jgi:hypothetical protein
MEKWKATQQRRKENYHSPRERVVADMLAMWTELNMPICEYPFLTMKPECKEVWLRLSLETLGIDGKE